MKGKISIIVSLIFLGVGIFIFTYTQKTEAPTIKSETQTSTTKKETSDQISDLDTKEEFILGCIGSGEGMLEIADCECIYNSLKANISLEGIIKMGLDYIDNEEISNNLLDSILIAYDECDIFSKEDLFKEEFIISCVGDEDELLNRNDCECIYNSLESHIGVEGIIQIGLDFMDEKEMADELTNAITQSYDDCGIEYDL